MGKERETGAELLTDNIVNVDINGTPIEFKNFAESEDGKYSLLVRDIKRKVRYKNQKRPVPQPGQKVELLYQIYKLDFLKTIDNIQNAMENFDPKLEPFINVDVHHTSFRFGRGSLTGTNETLEKVTDYIINVEDQDKDALFYADASKFYENAEPVILYIRLAGFCDENWLTDRYDGWLTPKLLSKYTEYKRPNSESIVNVDVTILSESDKSVRYEFINSTFNMNEGSKLKFITPGIELAIRNMFVGEEWELRCSSHFHISDNDFDSLKLAYVPDQYYIVKLKACYRAKEPWELTPHEKLTFCQRLKEESLKFINESQYKIAMNKCNMIAHYLYAESQLEGEDEKKRQYLLFSAYMNCSLAALKNEDYSVGVKRCDDALELQPNNVKALYRRGRCYYELREYEKAIQNFKQVLILEPNNFVALKYLNGAETAMKRYRTTEKDIILKMTSDLRQK